MLRKCAYCISLVDDVRERFASNNGRLLTMPFGPRVVLTRSAMAIAPTKEACSDLNALESVRWS